MPARTTRRLVVPALLVGALVVQLVVLYAPQVPGPPSPIPQSDKVVHAVVFALPVLVAGLGRRTWWPFVAVACAVHAPVSETLQHVVLAQRSGDPWDVLADLVGVVAASAAVVLSARRLRRRPSEARTPLST